MFGYSPICAGGDSFTEWMTKVISSWLKDYPHIAVGYVIIPQLGKSASRIVKRYHIRDMAPEEKQTLLNDQKLRALIEEHLQFRGSMEIPTETSLITINVDAEKVTVHKAPISAGFDRPIGYLVVLARYTGKASPLSKRIENVCEHISVSIRGERAATCLAHYADKNKDIHREIPLGDLIAQCKDVLGCRAIVLWRKDEKNGKAILKNVYSIPAIQTVAMYVGTGVAGTCAKTRKTVRFDNLWDDAEVHEKIGQPIKHREIVKANNWRSALFTPLIHGSEVYGVVGAYMSRIHSFNDLDEQILIVYADRIAAQIGSKEIANIIEAKKEIEKIIPVLNSTLNILSRIHDARNELSKAAQELSLLNLSDRRPAMYDYYYDRKRLAALAVGSATDLIRKELDDVRSLTAHRLDLKHRNMSTFLKEIVEENCNTLLSVHNINLVPSRLGTNSVAVFDPRVTKEIFVNLISNSKEFLRSQRGRKVIDIQLDHSTEGLRVTLGDNGPGISEDNREKIFNLFFSTKENGYGIGLTIAQIYMTLQGGTITCSRSARYEIGTDFVLQFPTN